MLTIAQLLLIVPYGIETRLGALSEKYIMLLIVPYGIETCTAFLGTSKPVRHSPCGVSQRNRSADKRIFVQLISLIRFFPLLRASE